MNKYTWIYCVLLYGVCLHVCRCMQAPGLLDSAKSRRTFKLKHDLNRIVNDPSPSRTNKRPDLRHKHQHKTSSPILIQRIHNPGYVHKVYATPRHARVTASPMTVSITTTFGDNSGIRKDHQMVRQYPWMITGSVNETSTLAHACNYHSDNEPMNRLSYYAARLIACQGTTDLHRMCTLDIHVPANLDHIMANLRYEIMGDLVLFTLTDGPKIFSAQIWRTIYDKQRRDYRLMWTSDPMNRLFRKLFDELNSSYNGQRPDTYKWERWEVRPEEYHTSNYTKNRLNYYMARYIACHGDRDCTLNSSYTTKENFTYTLNNLYETKKLVYTLLYPIKNNKYSRIVQITLQEVDETHNGPDYKVIKKIPQNLPNKFLNDSGIFENLRDYHNSEIVDYKHWKPVNLTLDEYVNILNPIIVKMTLRPTSRAKMTTVDPSYTSTVAFHYPKRNYIQLDNIRENFYLKMYRLAMSYLKCRGRESCFIPIRSSDKIKGKDVSPLWFAVNRCVMFFIELPTKRGPKTVHITFYEKVNESTGTMVNYDFLYSSWHTRSAFYKMIRMKPKKYEGPKYFNTLLYIHQLSQGYNTTKRSTTTRPTRSTTSRTTTTTSTRPSTTSRALPTSYIDETTTSSEISSTRIIHRKIHNKGKHNKSIVSTRIPMIPLGKVLQQLFDNMKSVFKKTIKKL